MYRLFPGVSTLRPRAVRALATRQRTSDPFPLPLDPSIEIPQEFPDPHPPITRDNESPDVLRARLIYQSRKRGTLEADLLLSTFASEHLPSMNVAELREFDKLMDEPDWDIYYWAIGKRNPPERWAQSTLLRKLKRHTANEGKVVRRMPDIAAK